VTMTHKVQRRAGDKEETVALQMTRTSSTDNLISDTNVDDTTCVQRSSNADSLLWSQFQKRLTTDQQERLRQVEEWRQQDEKFCPVVFGRRKSSITYLLQESSPITVGYLCTVYNQGCHFSSYNENNHVT